MTAQPRGYRSPYSPEGLDKTRGGARVDDDEVDLSNLQRQILHGTADVDRPKVESTIDAVARINPDPRIETHQMRLGPENVAELIADYEEKFNNPYVAAELGLVDEVIEPRETRVKLIRALEMLRTKRESLPPKKHGNGPQ